MLFLHMKGTKFLDVKRYMGSVFLRMLGMRTAAMKLGYSCAAKWSS
jgi:hypothetical protein